jgi:glycosyltransferase involved in cell wall biosynthesis
VTRVSVVIPTHDRADLVGRAVASALTQTMGDLEVIVVDDGSTDDTPSVLDGLVARDERVRVLRLEGVGAPGARNAGIDVARADLVAFLDDDDEWLPHKLELQVAHLDAHPDVSLVGCHHVVVGAGAEVEYRGPTTWHPDALLWCNFLGSASFVLVRRPPAFDPSFSACQDWDLWVRAASAGRAAIVPETLCRYTAEGADRLTASAPGRLAGHVRFEERHRAEMSKRCRAYHRARRVLLSASSAADNLRAVPRILPSTPPSVTAILGQEIVAARRGEADGDPGRGMRRLAELIGDRP